MYKKVFFILFVNFVLSFSLLAQDQTVSGNSKAAASNLPDISVVGDITNSTTTYGDYFRNEIAVREIEFAFQGYISTAARADVFLAMHRHDGVVEAEICEGYVTFLRILEGVNLKVGKIHVDFGKINKIHQHERPYADAPTALSNFLGEHGLIGEGLNLGYLLPLPFFAQLDLGAWNVASAHSHEEGEAHSEFGLANTVYSGRLWTSFATGENSELEIGGSGLYGNGSHYLEHQDDVKIYGLDLTFKLWPSSSERIIFQNELLHLVRQVPVGELKRYGIYSYLGYKLNKEYEIGVRYDLSDNAMPERERTSRLSGIFTNNLTEMTKLRLQYSYNIEANSHEAFIQLVFGIGPHSHPLQ